MALEDILYEAEKQGLRIKVLEKVSELKGELRGISLDSVYDIAWEQIKRQNNINADRHNN